MKPLRIVIADDHASLRQLIRSFLSSHAEYEVCGEAADGGEAISQARALHPDLILMDVSMPNVSGVDATRVIRAELPEIQVLLVSQNDPKVVARQASEAGARGWIAKSELHLQLLDQLDSLSRSREPDSSRLPSGRDDLS